MATKATTQREGKKVDVRTALLSLSLCSHPYRSILEKKNFFALQKPKPKKIKRKKKKKKKTEKLHLSDRIRQAVLNIHINE